MLGFAGMTAGQFLIAIFKSLMRQTLDILLIQLNHRRKLAAGTEGQTQIGLGLIERGDDGCLIVAEGGKDCGPFGQAKFGGHRIRQRANPAARGDDIRDDSLRNLCLFDFGSIPSISQQVVIQSPGMGIGRIKNRPIQSAQARGQPGMNRRSAGGIGRQQFLCRTDTQASRSHNRQKSIC